MKILAIETSCDETAIAIVDAAGTTENARFIVDANVLLSQADMHREFGGVYPNVAKREHAANLLPILIEVLKQAGQYREEQAPLDPDTKVELAKLLEREGNLSTTLVAYLETVRKPDINLIAVTAGPGLEPALWVGINFAQALGKAWSIPVAPINHMEGHVISSLMETIREKQYALPEFKFPLLALLISGGHTELVVSREWLHYELVGQTLDDAVGEAFDKAARMMNLPYPGGPEISKLAEAARNKNAKTLTSLPRPMIASGNCNFSFSGLKTAVLYAIQKDASLKAEQKEAFAREFEDSVTDVLVSKTKKALQEQGAKTLVVGGGVSANKNIRRALTEMIQNEFPAVQLFIPSQELTTDNALMIAAAGYLRYQLKQVPTGTIIARGTLTLSK